MIAVKCPEVHLKSRMNTVNQRTIHPIRGIIAVNHRMDAVKCRIVTTKYPKAATPCGAAADQKRVQPVGTLSSVLPATR